MYKKDWRLNGQENYLLNAKLIKKEYTGNDHDHCEFCWEKFMNKETAPPDFFDYSSEGYCTDDGNRWVCKKCFNDFKRLFKWKIIADKRYK